MAVNWKQQTKPKVIDISDDDDDTDDQDIPPQSFDLPPDGDFSEKKIITTPAKVEIVETPAATPANLEDAFSDIFGTSKSGTGEEELLRIASQFSLQMSAKQMKCLIYLIHRAETAESAGHLETGKLLRIFVQKWLEYKQNNNSDIFVMKALEHISLRHYINENSFKINVDK